MESSPRNIAATISASRKPEGGPLRAVEWVLIALVIVQVVTSLWYAPMAWGLTRTGAMSVPDFLLVTLSTVLLLVGAILLASKSRGSTFAFGAAATFGLLALHQWRPLISITCAVLALSACVVSAYHFRSSPKAPDGGA